MRCPQGTCTIDITDDSAESLQSTNRTCRNWHSPRALTYSRWISNIWFPFPSSPKTVCAGSGAFQWNRLFHFLCYQFSIKVGAWQSVASVLELLLSEQPDFFQLLFYLFFFGVLMPSKNSPPPSPDATAENLLAGTHQKQPFHSILPIPLYAEATCEPPHSHHTANEWHMPLGSGHSHLTSKPGKTEGQRPPPPRHLPQTHLLFDTQSIRLKEPNGDAPVMSFFFFFYVVEFLFRASESKAKCL